MTKHIISFDFKVGDKVFDKLTNDIVTVIGIIYENGKKKVTDNKTACDTIGYYVNSKYLEGGRHPWEINNI